MTLYTNSILEVYYLQFKVRILAAGIWQDRLLHKFEQILVVKMRIYKV